MLLLLLAGAGPAAAQYPERPLTMLTGYPAGGMVDIVARALAEGLKKKFPKGIGIVTRPGAGGSLAVSELVQAKPDGYTFILAPLSTLVIHPQLNDLPYKTPDDYEPIINVVSFYSLHRREGRCAVEDDAGVRRRGQGQPRQAAGGLAGRGHLEPSQPGGAQAPGRRQLHPCPVLGLGGVEPRPARRPYRGPRRPSPAR